VLALAWNWRGGDRERHPDRARRLAASLCAGIGGKTFSGETSGIDWAYRPIGRAASWRPAALDNGCWAFFHGCFDNTREIARALGTSATDPAFLYGLAVERWGDEADLHVIGEYCSVVADPNKRRLRLSRSPLHAPPLAYAQGGGVVAAASVPRALFAAGFSQQLNEARVADSAVLNYSDEEASWFEGVRRVPLGHVVMLEQGRERHLQRYYDVVDCPPVRMASDEDYIERAKELLDEGIRAALAGSNRPGVTLSGGLDSPLIAARTLAALPQGQGLPTFTFHPEDGWDGITTQGGNGDERGFVRAFAAMHPRLEPHFTDNKGYGHDHRWDHVFHLMGGAPTGLPNMYPLHGVFELAREQGCDLLLQSEWGNQTFSNRGQWGFVEYLLAGQWGQLWQALSRNPYDHRSILRRFLALSVAPLLPRPLYRGLRRTLKPNYRWTGDFFSPLSEGYRRESGAQERLQRSGIDFSAWHPRNRRHSLAIDVRRSDWEGAELYQAFEQLYGIRQRDPTAYRPFAEFCFGLPVRMFMRDGQMRWLAREMNKGIMPEEQRLTTLNGRWDADWHLRIGRRRKEYLAELDRLAADPRFAHMLDIARIRRELEDFPDSTPEGDKMYALEFGLPRLLLTARFVKWAEGHNR